MTKNDIALAAFARHLRLLAERGSAHRVESSTRTLPLDVAAEAGTTEVGAGALVVVCVPGPAEVDYSAVAATGAADGWAIEVDGGDVEAVTRAIELAVAG